MSKKKPTRRIGGAAKHRSSSTHGAETPRGPRISDKKAGKNSPKKVKKAEGSEKAAKKTSQTDPMEARGGDSDKSFGSPSRSDQKTAKTTPKPRIQPSQKRLATETAPSLAQTPRRRTAGEVFAEAKPTTAATPSSKRETEQASPVSTPTAPQPRSIANEFEDDDARFRDIYPSGPIDVEMLGIGSPFIPPHQDFEGEYLFEESPQEAASPFADDPSVEMRIREIQERLDGLMASAPHEDLDVGPAPAPEVVAPTSADTAVDAAREVLESDYYRKKWGRASLRDRTQEVDDFGMDPDYEERLRPALDFLFKTYFRVEVEGIRNIPTEGRGVVVANHSGALPFDGVMLREAVRQRHSGRNDLRWLAEDFSFYLPFLGVTLNRLGAVRACPENAERLLARNHLVGVFPEGAEGTKKLYKNRYRLQRFGRGGFVRLCLNTRSPIIPCAIIGAEETNPILYRFDNLSKLLGLDYLPITPTFPLLGPLGLIPAPTKWKIIFGDPISVDEYGPSAAQDHVLVGRLSERVRTNINDLLETSLRRRESIWF